MKKTFCKWLLQRLGWNIRTAGENPDKCVICVAPHTSNTDFILGQLYCAAIGLRASFLMKKEWFFFPFNLLFKSLGGIPVNRREKSSLTEQLAGEFSRRRRFRLVITPEGTRKKVDEWKKGFYYIALKAQVPIQIAYLNYKKKEAGVRATFYPTGNVDEDIRTIRTYYQGMKGRHQDRFGELNG